MASDTQRMRGDRPWTFTNLKQGDGLSTIIAFLEDKGMLGNRPVAPAGRKRVRMVQPLLSLYHPASTSAPRLPCNMA